MHLRFATLTLAAIVATAATASAAALYDNAPVASNVAQNKYNLSIDTARNFAMSKVEVGPAGWSIDSLTSYHTYSGNIAAVDFSAGAHLHIVPEADLAAFDPTSTADVEDVTVVNLQTPGGFFGPPGLVSLTVDPVADIELSEGSYWIGITAMVDNENLALGPLLSFARRGELPSEVAFYSVGPNGSTSSTSASVHDEWQVREDSMALMINGAKVPEPSTVALLSIAGLAGLAVMRRRRS